MNLEHEYSNNNASETNNKKKELIFLRFRTESTLIYLCFCNFTIRYGVYLSNQRVLMVIYTIVWSVCTTITPTQSRNSMCKNAVMLFVFLTQAFFFALCICSKGGSNSCSDLFQGRLYVNAYHMWCWGSDASYCRALEVFAPFFTIHSSVGWSVSVI